MTLVYILLGLLAFYLWLRGWWFIALVFWLVWIIASHANVQDMAIAAAVLFAPFGVRVLILDIRFLREARAARLAGANVPPGQARLS